MDDTSGTRTPSRGGARRCIMGVIPPRLPCTERNRRRCGAWKASPTACRGSQPWTSGDRGAAHSGRRRMGAAPRVQPSRVRRRGRGIRDRGTSLVEASSDQRSFRPPRRPSSGDRHADSSLPEHSTPHEPRITRAASINRSGRTPVRPAGCRDVREGFVSTFAASTGLARRPTRSAPNSRCSGPAEFDGPLPDRSGQRCPS